MAKRLFQIECSYNHMRKRWKAYQVLVSSLLTQHHMQWSKAEKEAVGCSNVLKNSDNHSAKSELSELKNHQANFNRHDFDGEELTERKQKMELEWFSKALEPAMQLYRWALPAGSNSMQQVPSRSRSIAEIIASLQRSKAGLPEWSLSDLTVGLYLIYLRRASECLPEDFQGVQISSDSQVSYLIYHVELAKGAYRENAAALTRNSMLREGHILKFVRDSCLLRPGYYIATDPRNKSVIVGIRGTHTVYDLITDMVSSSDEEVTLEGYSTHFGTAEAARWFIHYELETIRKCLQKHEGFKLKLVGHSLGGATAALLAIMLRKRSKQELGFSPDIVSSVGFGTPPCVSKELAESCTEFVSSVVLQDDIIPRLSSASLMRLRNEILQTDWTRIFEKEDWKRVTDLVTNAKQVVSSIQDIARKCTEYANFNSAKGVSGISNKDSVVTKKSSATQHPGASSHVPEKEKSSPTELFLPGKLYHLRRNVETSAIGGDAIEYYTLWKGHPGVHFRNIVLSSNLISDHKCDNHYYALRDVLKGLPSSGYQEVCW
ncbi:uncharacterized protein LOC116266150 isoform X1 [Nymphaea colorata]|nr:uncharacterized protein LOC116266150 isoform X1 [Nymphaea colorata]